MTSGITKLVQRIQDDPDGPFKTVGEVAEYLEVSKDTIRRWGKTIGVPNHKMELNEEGTSFVWLYTEEDVDALELFSATVKPGRPKHQED